MKHAFLASAFVTLLLASASISLAQAPVTPAPPPPVPLAAGPTDPVLLRIARIGTDSSWLPKLAQQLLDSIGPRLGGTQNHRNAIDWALRNYQAWGIEAKQEQYGTWRGWRRGYSHIDLIAPRVRSLEGTMLGFSPGTGGKDVTATTVILPIVADTTEFVKWLPTVKDKFVLVAGLQPTCRPTDDWEENASPESKAKMDSAKAQLTREWQQRIRNTGYSLAIGTGSLGRRLEDAGAAGVITSRPKNAWGTIEIFETYNQKAPAVALSCEDYGLLYRLTENKQGPMLRLNLDAELQPEAPIFNAIATIKGSTKPEEYVILSAHFDSWDGGSGATDDGAGSLSMMEAMRILKLVLPRPTRTIMVGHWAAEENGLIGSRAFTEDHPEVLKGLQALFNEDGGTGRIQRMGASGLPNAAVHIQTWLSKLPPAFNSQVGFSGVGFPSGGGTDSGSFSCHGLPAFGLGGQSWSYSNYTWHTQRDTYDKLVFDDLKFNATLTAMLAYLAAEDPTMISRERLDLVKAAQEAAAQPTTTPGSGWTGAWTTDLAGVQHGPADYQSEIGVK